MLGGGEVLGSQGGRRGLLRTLNLTGLEDLLGFTKRTYSNLKTTNTGK